MATATLLETIAARAALKTAVESYIGGASASFTAKGSDPLLMSDDAAFTVILNNAKSSATVLASALSKINQAEKDFLANTYGVK